jgi:hypothetical protein
VGFWSKAVSIQKIKKKKPPEDHDDLRRFSIFPANLPAHKAINRKLRQQEMAV